MEPRVPTPTETTNVKRMDPVGPWATGRSDWHSDVGLVGVRSVVDQYSIARYDTRQWKTRIEELARKSYNQCEESFKIEDRSKNAVQNAAVLADKNQNKCKGLINGRAHDIHELRTELARSIDTIEKEMNMLQDEIHRIQRCIGTVDLVALLSKECINQRCFRMESDLVHDKVEEELIKEFSLVNEVNELLKKTLKQFEEQLERCEFVKGKLEWDWSNKRQAYDLETTNVGLNTQSTTALFTPGAARAPDNQVTPPLWKERTEEGLAIALEASNQAEELKAVLNNTVLMDIVRDLRIQADNVDLALKKRIAETEQSRVVLETCLDKVLKRMSTTENTIMNLQNMIRNLDQMTKVAQTRLKNRNNRPFAESTRDEAHMRLMEEVKTLLDESSVLQKRVKEAEDVHAELYESRKDLERELQIKLKTLWVNRERCLPVRAHYPSVAALSGHIVD